MRNHRAGWHYPTCTLPGSMARYGEHAQTRTFENHARLRNYVRGHTEASAIHSIKSLYLLSTLNATRDKLFQAPNRFSVLQVTESWVGAGPGNEATY